MTRRLVCVLLFGACLKPTLAIAIILPAECLGVRVGFGGQYKVGLWTPVEVFFDSGELPETVTVTVPDGDGVPSRVRAPARNNPVRLYVRFGRIDSKMTVSYGHGDDVFPPLTLSSPNDYRSAISATGKLIVTVGADSLGVQEAVDALHRSGQQPIAVASLLDCRQLPDRWYGYEGVDALVLSTSRPDVPALDEPQAAALDKWIAMGGRLVVCVGSRAEGVLAAGSPLARFAPGRLKTMVSLRQTGALETFADGSVPVPAVSGTRLSLAAPQLIDCGGVIEAREADLPLVVRSRRGFGQIIFLAADLDAGPLAAWRDRPKLAARLLDLPAGAVEELDESTALMHFGFNDMAGQLRSALDRFQGVHPAPFSLVVGLIVVYLLAIGPVDYLLLRKFTRRMRWTWLSFPAVVLAFCVAAYLLAFRLKGDRVRICQAEVVDVDAASRLVRGTSWANLLSPRAETFNLALRPNSPLQAAQHDTDVLVSWLGLPGEALGGMNPRASNPVPWTQHYDFSPSLDEIQRVPIQVWATKSLTARWSASDGACLKARLVSTGTSPSGTITNTLGFPLSECILAYHRWAYDLGTLEPDSSARLGPMVKRCELKTLLTGRRIVSSKEQENLRHKYRQETTPFDQASVDPAYVLRAMMFFEAAGGRRYTHLTNGYQNFVDLSDLLKTDCAILVAGGPDRKPAAEWLRDGKPIAAEDDQHVTIYRFLFPVEKVEAAQ